MADSAHDMINGSHKKKNTWIGPNPADGLENILNIALNSTFLHSSATTSKLLHQPLAGAERWGFKGVMNAACEIPCKTFQPWRCDPMCGSVVQDPRLNGREPKQPEAVSGLRPSLCSSLSSSVRLRSLHSSPAAPQGVSTQNCSLRKDVFSCRLLALHLAMMQQSSAHHFQEKEHRDTTVSGWTMIPLFYFLVVFVFFKPLKRITTAPVTNIGINIIHMSINGGITSSFLSNLLKKIYYATVFFFLFFFCSLTVITKVRCASRL